VRDESGTDDDGVELKRSVYEINESRFDGACGDGGGRELLVATEPDEGTVAGVGCTGAITSSSSVVGVGRNAPGIAGPKLLACACMTGRMGCIGGRGAVTLGLGLGSLAERVAVGLGLRLLRRDVGLARPLRDVAASSGLGIVGAITATESSGDASTVAALSRTDGTAYSICSVAFPRGILCGLGGWWGFGGDGAIGSISRSKIADEDECLWM
jgi:hypothetical protein